MPPKNDGSETCKVTMLNAYTRSALRSRTQKCYAGKGKAEARRHQMANVNGGFVGLLWVWVLGVVAGKAAVDT